MQNSSLLPSTATLLAATGILLYATSHLWNNEDGSRETSFNYNNEANKGDDDHDDDSSDDMVVKISVEKGQEQMNHGAKEKNTTSNLPSEISRSDRDEHETASKVIAPFPWEIASSPNNNQNDHHRRYSASSDDVPSATIAQPSNDDPSTRMHSTSNRHLASSSSSSGQQSQLDFLSSMTFANGGLRSPSCPCCI